jgi:hypothetical protein
VSLWVHINAKLLPTVVPDRQACAGERGPKLLRSACLIGGGWVQADSKKAINVENPATGTVREPRTPGESDQPGIFKWLARACWNPNQRIYLSAIPTRKRGVFISR